MLSRVVFPTGSVEKRRRWQLDCHEENFFVKSVISLTIIVTVTISCVATTIDVCKQIAARSGLKMNKNYLRKYQLLKKRVKDVIFVSATTLSTRKHRNIPIKPFQENAALCDQVSQIQENLSKAMDEQKFLRKRLMSYDPECLLPENFVEKKPPMRKKSQDRVKPNRFSTASRDSLSSPPKNGKGTATTTSTLPLEPFTKAKVKIEQSSVEVVNPPPPADVKSEELEPEIPFVDQSTIAAGGVSYAIGNLMVQSLGEIQADKPSFHTEHTIYPVGYTSIRIYGSMGNPFLKSVYTCRITEAVGNPRFEMSSEADSSVMIVGPSAQFCHSTLLRYMQDTHGLQRLSTVTPDGDWFFGLSHPVVMSLMKSMPNFNTCTKFQGCALVHNELTIAEKENDPGINFETFLHLVEQPQEEVMYHEDIEEENAGLV